MSKRIKIEHAVVHYKKVPTIRDRSNEAEAHAIVFTERHYYLFGLLHRDIRYSYTASGKKEVFHEPTTRTEFMWSLTYWSMNYDDAKAHFIDCEKREYETKYYEL